LRVNEREGKSNGEKHGALSLGRGREARQKQGWWLTNTRENSMEIHGLSIHLLGIIRMEREGVEKAGVEELMSGVQGMGSRGGKD